MPFRFEEYVVRTSPSIAPNGLERDVYLVLDDFGCLGRAWRETDEAGASRPALVRNLLEGQYENPVRIVAFNTAEGWSRDVTLSPTNCGDATSSTTKYQPQSPNSWRPPAGTDCDDRHCGTWRLSDMHYRTYFLDQDGHISNAIDMECTDDQQAKECAKKFLSDRNAELWKEDQLVAIYTAGKGPLPPPSDQQASRLRR
jgi:hypothetical protein